MRRGGLADENLFAGRVIRSTVPLKNLAEDQHDHSPVDISVSDNGHPLNQYPDNQHPWQKRLPSAMDVFFCQKHEKIIAPIVDCDELCDVKRSII